MITLTQHPLSAAFPAMHADEFQEHKDSIECNGVLNPITVLDGMVLDGWHRYKAATELGMDCPMVALGGIDPRNFVLAQNKARRNLTASQRADVVTTVYAWVASNGVNQYTVETGGEVTSPPLKTNAEMAEIAGTTPRTIQHAKVMHAGAVPAVQDAVKAGAVSVETAAAMARLPVATQCAIAEQGPDAMRAATKVHRKGGTCSTRTGAEIGTCSRKAAQALTEKEAKAAQVAQDAHGDTDPIAMWEAAEAENSKLRSLLATAEADDQKAEAIKWHRMTEIAQRRQNELMDTVNQRERELQRMANWLRRIGVALGETDNSKLPALVEVLARTTAVQAQTQVTPAHLAESLHGNSEIQQNSTSGTSSTLAGTNYDPDEGEEF